VPRKATKAFFSVFDLFRPENAKMAEKDVFVVFD
jgi:hypothetical protein